MLTGNMETPADRQEFADSVYDTRDALDLTQEEFATHLGVCLSTVQKWEAGTAVPGTHATKKALADAMKDAERAR